MLSSTKRRILLLERSIELPITADRFLASVQDRIRFTSESLAEAFRSLLFPLSIENLNRREEEIMQRCSCGGNATEDSSKAPNEAKSE